MAASSRRRRRRLRYDGCVMALNSNQLASMCDWYNQLQGHTEVTTMTTGPLRPKERHPGNYQTINKIIADPTFDCLEYHYRTNDALEADLKSRGLDLGEFPLKEALVSRLKSDDYACQRLRSGKVRFNPDRKLIRQYPGGTTLKRAIRLRNAQKAIEHNTTAKVLFFELPAEIRVAIYGFAIPATSLTNGTTHRVTRIYSNDPDLIPFASDRKGRKILLSDHEHPLLRTCSLIRKEALPVYYSLQNYVFDENLLSDPKSYFPYGPPNWQPRRQLLRPSRELGSKNRCEAHPASRRAPPYPRCSSQPRGRHLPAL